MANRDHSNVPCSSTFVTASNCNSLKTGSQVISEEGYVPKIRKPYTITKQREAWTEEEHKRFLEALKLYGRAWSKIKEHVGTKTALQLRSHAQKFFTKVVRESNKSNSVGSIEIPPPRPKRKPTYPYPRKLVFPAKKSSLYQENQSPNSVVSAFPSECLGSEGSSNIYRSCSAVSANTSSEDEPSVQENVSEPDELVSVKLELLPKNDATCTKSLRLFGKNLAIMDVGNPFTSSASFSNQKSQDTSQELSPERPDDPFSDPRSVKLGSQAVYGGMQLPFLLRTHSISHC